MKERQSVARQRDGNHPCASWPIADLRPRSFDGRPLDNLNVAAKTLGEAQRDDVLLTRSTTPKVYHSPWRCLRKRSMLRRSFFVGRPVPRSRWNNGATNSCGGTGGL
jgi:hypothetical protein